MRTCSEGAFREHPDPVQHLRHKIRPQLQREKEREGAMTTLVLECRRGEAKSKCCDRVGCLRCIDVCREGGQPRYPHRNSNAPFPPCNLHFHREGTIGVKKERMNAHKSR